MKSPADWTVDELIALFLGVYPNARVIGRRRGEYASDVRAALKARTLNAAAWELADRGWLEAMTNARKLREAAGIIDPGKCPTCGRE